MLSSYVKEVPENWMTVQAGNLCLCGKIGSRKEIEEAACMYAVSVKRHYLVAFDTRL
jgi:hypothetical protein